MIGKCAYTTIVCIIANTNYSLTFTKDIKHIVITTGEYDSAIKFLINFTGGGSGMSLNSVNLPLVINDINLPRGSILYARCNTAGKNLQITYFYDEE